jgi:streptomycin 6-kinase
MEIPSSLSASCSGAPERAGWLERLPEVLRRLEQRWALTPDTQLDGEEPSCSYVTAVKAANGMPAVLKIAMPHMEGEQEIQGLFFWDGDPFVRLLEFDEELGAMLLERCLPGSPLRTLAEDEQDVVIAGLLRRLWRQPLAPHPFRPLSALTRYWADETRSQIEQERNIDIGLVSAGLRLLEELPGTATRTALLATDLHAGNVVRAQREPWLVIDPKPFLGDPAYDATQHLLNCRRRLQSNLVRTMQNFAELAEIEYERVRLWTFARAAAEPRSDWNNDSLISLARAIAP